MSCKPGYAEKLINLNDGNKIKLCVQTDCNNNEKYTFSDNENIETKKFSLDFLKRSTKEFNYICINKNSSLDKNDCDFNEKKNKLGQCIKFADQYILDTESNRNIINNTPSVPQMPIIDIMNDIQKRLICTNPTTSENDCRILGGNWDRDNNKCMNPLPSLKDEELDSDECNNVGGMQSDGQCILNDGITEESCTSNPRYLYSPANNKCYKQISTYQEICHGMSGKRSTGDSGDSGDSNEGSSNGSYGSSDYGSGTSEQPPTNTEIPPGDSNQGSSNGSYGSSDYGSGTSEQPPTNTEITPEETPAGEETQNEVIDQDETTTDQTEQTEVPPPPPPPTLDPNREFDDDETGEAV